MLKLNNVYHGDCLTVLKEVDDNSIDTIITDPPYGMSFMGKKWDYDVPTIEVWKECLRVLKPGGTALVFAGSRTQHRMAVNVEDAGFILKDCIMWLYGSGFPKATDISKQLDKSAGAERKVIATRKAHDIRNNNLMEASQGKDRGTMQYHYTAPATDEAKLWSGWKSHGLKPAYEPILVAMKPNDGTYAENAIKHGVSGLNIDGARIEHDESVKTTMREPDKGHTWNDDNCGLRNGGEGLASANPDGRFPANIIFDEQAVTLLDMQSPQASRFFYCAKASTKERNEGQPTSNIHPTVKPLKLMEYLCNLTATPTGGTVLDPFAGSGTTGKACQNTRRSFILIEKEFEYVKIAKKRIGTESEGAHDCDR